MENENNQQVLDLEENSEILVENDTGKEETLDSETEQQEYSSSVQKRINKLTHKMRESQRREEEALNYARSVVTENKDIKQRINQLDKGYVEEYGGRVDAEEKQVEEELRRAVEISDTDATIKAQKRLTEIAVAKDKVQQAKIAQERQEQLAQQQQQQQQQIPPQVNSPPPVDPQAQQWAQQEENSWFGKDDPYSTVKTFAAFGIHKVLVEQENYDPQSAEYYAELNKRIKNYFPDKFDNVDYNEQNTINNEPSRRNVQTVAGNSRTKNTGRSTKVRLTETQKVIAQKLGVPLEEYAKSLLKMQNERRTNS